MKFKSCTILSAIVFLFLFSTACKKVDKSPDLQTEFALAKSASGNVAVRFPEQDPGGPFYMRGGNLLNQFFVNKGWLVLPFYREPSCVPEDFNLLTVFDPPAAFRCPLTVSGMFIIEKDAQPGTFPIIVNSSGNAVPFWFVRWNEFQQAAADGEMTITELLSLRPLRGVATKFTETLKPRMEHHLVQINASGDLEDGRSFRFHVTHVGNRTTGIELIMK